ncbi:MAG TPA: DUF2341 domain-containing protein [Verrucomicrobiae bacterium]
MRIARRQQRRSFTACATALCVALLLLSARIASAANLSDPAVDRFNVRVGTQTFAGLYQFTTNTLLVETAQAILDLGSDTIKMYLASDFPRQYRITLKPGITNLVALARDEPSCRTVFNLPFRNYIAWIYPFSGWWPLDGYSATEAANEYRETYDLARYFLTNFNNSGKTFYLGHWEGDGYLCPNANWTTNPTPTMIQGFINSLNTRQKAIDDAKRNTTFTNVNVFCYAEANRVRDAIANQPGSNLRMINSVVPYVTNLDFLSYSSYDAQNLSKADLYATLDYMESMVPTNKASVLPGERIWIGEYGWGYLKPEQQEPNTRAYIQRLLNYGRQALPFILFWEIYNNEPGNYFCLVDSNNVKVASWQLHQRFINNARLAAARFKETNGRLPGDSEFVSLVSPMLDRPLPALEHVSFTNLSATLLSTALAKVTATIAQGIYGDDFASMWLYWGRQDGGTNRNSWEHRQSIALHTNFNPRTYAVLLTNLPSNTNFFFRFYGTNSSGEFWTPTPIRLSTQALNPADFRYRMAIQFTGYDRESALTAFPALVNLSTSLAGFSYQQFASPIGGDLRFTDAGGLLPIPFEIDEWNPSGTSRVWVRVPLLSGTNDLVWAYWGNSTATNLPSSSTNGSVWAADHLLVWHLKQSGLPYADSSGQHPALTGKAPSKTAGVVGSGSYFDGSSTWLNAGPVSLRDVFTLSAWVKVDATATNIQTVWANKAGGWTSDGCALYLNTYNTADRQLRFETGDGVTGIAATTLPNAVSYGQWHLVSAVVDRSGGTVRLYVDGIDRTVDSATQPGFANQSALNLGRLTNNALYFKGVIDEVRIETGARSADWIWANWLTAAGNNVLTAYSAVNPRPTLSFSANQASPEISWPASAGAFALFMATNLLPPVFWMSVPAPPMYFGTQWRMPLNPTGSAAFYRLEQ